MNTLTRIQFMEETYKLKCIYKNTKGVDIWHV